MTINQTTRSNLSQFGLALYNAPNESQRQIITLTKQLIIYYLLYNKKILKINPTQNT